MGAGRHPNRETNDFTCAGPLYTSAGRGFKGLSPVLYYWKMDAYLPGGLTLGCRCVTFPSGVLKNTFCIVPYWPMHTHDRLPKTATTTRLR